MRENSRYTREDPLLHRIGGNRELRDSLKGWKEAVTLKSFQANTSYERGGKDGYSGYSGYLRAGKHGGSCSYTRATTIERQCHDVRSTPQPSA
ncbi:hypothetical protein K0M31_017511 [Melipona bicolor]|uniref:Uncharacterized protein n=1 Tax=Melipona bicolor TaxID=60889 RepID=A0AA40G5R4_9HYME|nr:hypothetical protein K0M31_017511 [Melipona bicolor]